MTPIEHSHILTVNITKEIYTFDWIKNIFRKQDKPTLHMPSQDFKRRVEAAAVERAAARKVPSYRNPAPHASAPRSGPYGKPQPQRERDTHIVDNGLSTLDYAVMATVLSDTSYRSDSCSSSHESSPSSSYDSGSSSCDSGSSSSSD